MDFYRLMLDNSDELTEMRRTLHRNPELSFMEYETAKYIENRLSEWGMNSERIGETGVYAEITGGKGCGPIVALRADIDALPVEEETGLPYASKNKGVMHACGHDMHTACLLAAAKALQECRNQFAGSVRLLFQPAEELGGGSRPFIQAGKMRGVSRVFGIHSAPDLKLGTVGITPGPNNASVDRFHITIHGKAAHVSTPQLGKDALIAAAQTVIALQSMVTRRTSPTEPVIIGVGKLKAGTAYNIVADTAEIEGTTRLFTEELRRKVNAMVAQTAKSVAEMYGTSAEIEWAGDSPPLENPRSICEEVWPIVGSMLGEDAIIRSRPLSCCGDNFSDLQAEAPGIYAYVGVHSDSVAGSEGPLHNSRYVVDERALPIGAALYAQTSWHWLTGE